ncbi:peptidase S41 family protein [Coniochaeta sp. 2T2.1]|nr:peptidase S41 family protein [Coniochaeta sp. 2T2.1]
MPAPRYRPPRRRFSSRARQVSHNPSEGTTPDEKSAHTNSPKATPSIPATLAHACLQSVPNKPDPAARLIASLKAFVNWQSTLAWLKDPPASYMFPAVDIQGGLDNISATAVAGGFASEYDFQLSIVELISSAHDGHFAYRPDVFKAFIFRNSLVADLVSVSRDGLEVPKLYHYSDLTGNGTAVTNGTNLPRAITKINGQDAAAFVEATTLKYSNYQDPDSQWNSQFATYASPGALPIIAASLFFQTPSITLTYDNGEEKTQDSVAAVRRTVDFAGVSTGEDFYTKFCDPVLAVDQLAENATTTAPTPTSTSSATTLATAAAEPTISGYPFPVVRDVSSNITAGYFLNGTGYDDVAVLSVSAFAPAGDIDAVTYLNDFQKTVETFLAACKTAGKKRLVIDVTANGGGYVVAGYDLFAQLFPDTPQFQGHNLRLTSSMDDLARIANSIPDTLSSNTTTDQAEALFALQNSEVVSNLIPGSVFSPTGENLTSVDAILAPVTLHGDRFTAYQSTPLNDTSAEYNLTGVGSRSDPAPAVFLPQDVVLLTDGTCGSTCTLFSYLLVTQLNVSTAVVGGRPQTGVMQSIAGVEGAQVFPLTSISAAASAALALSPPDRVKEMNGSDLAVIAEGYALARGATPGNPGAVNGKNAFARSDAETPLQFLYQPGNCRFFYTAEMVRGPEKVWERAVDATWRDPEAWCVEGSRVALDMMARPDDPLFRQAGKVQAEGAQDSAAVRGRREGLRLGVVVAVVVAVMFKLM